MDAGRSTKAARIQGEARGARTISDEEDWEERAERLFRDLRELYGRNPAAAHQIVNRSVKEVDEERRKAAKAQKEEEKR